MTPAGTSARRSGAEWGALVAPDRTIAAALADSRTGAWRLLRRPLLLLAISGGLVSFMVSGRLSVRLVVDGAISFSFVPIFAVASLRVVASRWRMRAVPFPVFVDTFLAMNGPAYLWLLLIVTFRAFQTPAQAGDWPLLEIWITQMTMAAALVWTIHLERRVLRSVFPNRAQDAARALVTQIAIAWGGSLVYFFGIAAWGRMAWVWPW